MTGDAATVARQLGRAPRGRWRPVARCSYGRPTVILTGPVLGDGTPFPTLYYLTCPHLTERVSALESAGEIERWRARIAGDPALRELLSAADTAYRAARAAEAGGAGASAAEAGGADPVPDVGIAGQRDPCALKCLHAHVAAFLAGVDDPVGAGVLAAVVRECDDDRCGSEA